MFSLITIFGITVISFAIAVIAYFIILSVRIIKNEKLEEKFDVNKEKTTLFVAIEKTDYEAIRQIANKEGKTISEIAREALNDFFNKKS